MNEKFLRKIGNGKKIDSADDELSELKKRIWEKHLLLEEMVLQRQLGELKEKVHIEMKKGIKERLKNNPKPTEEESRRI